MASLGYPYVPLESAKHIRLLKVLPGRLASEFMCELIHTSIDESPRYEALSYVWGDPQQRETIVCNGRTFDVGKSLGSALYRLRLYDDERLLWIDAICIDQSSVPEKNSQLPLMRRIYQQAEQVIVWICPETAGCARAKSMIAALINVYNGHKYMRDAYAEEQQQQPEQIGQNFVTSQIDFIERELEERTSTKVTRHGLMLDMEEERCSLPGLTSTDWGYLDLLYDAKWFHRVWTIQEMIVANNVEVVFGEESCSWDHFFYAAYCMAGSLLPSVPVHWHNAMWLDLHRGHFRSEGSLSLLMLLNECHERDATQPHDKVYALLGLAEKQEEIYKEDSLLKPDYGLPIEEVYRRVAVHFLAVLRIPDVLRAVHETRLHSGLPTWVPDWSGSRPKPFLTSVGSWYRSGGDINDMDIQTASLHPSDPNILQIKGTLYDTVAVIGSVMSAEENETISERKGSKDEYGASHQQLATQARCWREWEAMAQLHEDIPYPSLNKSRENAYWRTLIGDCSDDFSAPADDEYRYNYKQWRNHMRRARGGFFTNPTVDEWNASSGHSGEIPDDEVMGVLHGLNDPYFKAFYERNIRAAALMSFAVTAKGYFALIPSAAGVGDTVCVVPGVKTPILLRRESDVGSEPFKLIGACFVHGIMNGETLEGSYKSEVKSISII